MKYIIHGSENQLDTAVRMTFLEHIIRKDCDASIHWLWGSVTQNQNDIQ